MKTEEGTAQSISGQYDCPSVNPQSKSIESDYDYEPYDVADSSEPQERSSGSPMVCTVSLFWHPRLLFCTFCLLIWYTVESLYNNAGLLSCDVLKDGRVQSHASLSYRATDPTLVTARMVINLYLPKVLTNP